MYIVKLYYILYYTPQSVSSYSIPMYVIKCWLAASYILIQTALLLVLVHVTCNSCIVATSVTINFQDVFVQHSTRLLVTGVPNIAY